MRTVIAIVALASSAVSAQAAEDRYGPPPAPRLLAAVGVAGQAQAARSLAPTPYTGRMLGWSGKVAPRALEQAQQPQPAPQYQPQPVAARAPVPFQPQTPRVTPPAQPPQPAAGLPQNLYDRRMDAPAPAPRYAPQYQPEPVAVRSAPVQPPAPQVAPRQRQAALPGELYDRPMAAPPRAPQPTPQAQPQPQPAPRERAGAGDGGARSYSVIREYGGQPDRIALPPPTSYWATREQTQPALADPTYGAGLSKKSGEAEPADGCPERRRPGAPYRRYR